MIAALIRSSIANRFLVLMATLMLSACGNVVARAYVARCNSRPVRCASHYSHHVSGQAPQIVENQVTYPLTTTMLSVPGAKTVRGYSFFGDSFVYILFEDGTDPYWARSRVLEYLNQVQARLPTQAEGFTRTRRNRRGMGVRIRSRRSHRQDGSFATARAPGLVS
jgi:Cu(I)/Ag(I) efflux system membrane protein CusA/SilA